MPDIRAIISDLDDTLLTSDHQLTERTETTLRRLTRQGVKVVLASGRSAASMRPTVERINTPCPYIAFNGAQIVDSRTHAVRYAREIPLALARDVLKWFEAQGIYVQYYDGDDWFFAERCTLSDDYAASTGVPGTEAGTLSDHITAGSPKILAIAEPQRVPALIEKGSVRFGRDLILTTSKPYFIEITSPLATKGHAVRALAEMIGLSPETTIVCGDSLNDLSMLEWSKWPVTVSNGREEIRKMAWRIAGNGHEDGIAILLDALIPPNEPHKGGTTDAD